MNLCFFGAKDAESRLSTAAVIRSASVLDEDAGEDEDEDEDEDAVRLVVLLVLCAREPSTTSIFKIQITNRRCYLYLTSQRERGAELQLGLRRPGHHEELNDSSI